MDTHHTDMPDTVSHLPSQTSTLPGTCVQTLASEVLQLCPSAATWEMSCLCPELSSCPWQVAREEVAELIRADAADVAPVVNATSAVQAVAASVQLQPGDMILITSITYNAVSD